jgi:hypothetical protein
MPPPTGVVSGPLIATRNSRIASMESVASQSVNFALAFSAGEDLVPHTCDFFRLYALCHSWSKPAPKPSNVPPGAIALDEGDDRPGTDT